MCKGQEGFNLVPRCFATVQHECVEGRGRVYFTCYIGGLVVHVLPELT